MAAECVIVSVIVPAYNAAATIITTLDSALSQTLREIEVIVVDDGSSDKTCDLVTSIAEKDKRVRLIRQKNAGVGAARNTAIQAACGKYIAPMDADDTWLPEKLERQVERMEECGEQTGIAYCGSNIIDEKGAVVSVNPIRTFEGRMHRMLIVQNFIGGASVPLFRAAALHEVGLYLERSQAGGSQGCEDWDLAVRIAEKFELCAVPFSLVNYRQMDSCMSVNSSGMSGSYEVMLKRAKIRNPELPRAVFRWSAGGFYTYLASKQIRWNDYPGCLLCLMKGVMSDPVMLLNPKTHRLAVKSILEISGKTFFGKISMGERHQRSGSRPSGQQPERKKRRGGLGSRLFERILEHRKKSVTRFTSPSRICH